VNLLDPAGILNKLQISRESAIQLVLAFFILVGLVTKGVISFFFRLDSDSVGMGVMAMEIGNHGNIFLSGCHLLSSDSLVFTELIPFQLVPQILTGYSPVALRMVTFIIFVLSVAVFSLILYFVSNRTFPALLFAALAANIPPEGYHWLAFPTSHNATILAGAGILLILLWLKRTSERGPEPVGKNRRKKTEVGSDIPWPYLLVISLMGFFTVFSDTIILFWLFIPFILAYIVFAERRTHVMNLAVGILAMVSALAYMLKTFFMPTWLAANYAVNSIHEILFRNVALFFRAFAEFISSGLFFLLDGRETGPLEILSVLLGAAVIIVLVRNAWQDWGKENPERKFLGAVILISLLVMFASFLISGYAYDINTARYLTFPALILLVGLALFSPEHDTIFIILVIGLLLVASVTGFVFISHMDRNPNEREYSLISYLEAQDLAFGYGTYWDANVITYLSGERVIIRSTYFLPDTIRPFLLNSCDGYYESRPERFFLINDTTLVSESAQKNLPSLLKTANVTDVLHYLNYDIYPVQAPGKS